MGAPPPSADDPADTPADDPADDPADHDAVRALVEGVLTWHRPDDRDLPWRAPGTTPWGILLSEVMAQQTQAERVAGRWVELVERFPDPSAMAEAAPAEVIDLWVGLGYNRRAVNLHRAAVVMVEEHGGEVPDDLDGLLALPGVGPYTARAVLAFAFDRDVVPVDTNVARIVARHTGRVLDRADAQALADGAVRWGRGAAAAAALMDLGATVCRARTPACEGCPVMATCSWAGGPEEDPAGRGAHRPRPQGRFEGSARQARGRIIAAARAGLLHHSAALDLAGEHGEAVLDALVADGLVVRDGEGFALPQTTGKSRGGERDRED